MKPITFDNTSYLVDGKPFYLNSGEFHYFRVPRADWRRRMQLLKEAGGNCVATYIPWSVHEPEEGRFSFDGVSSITWRSSSRPRPRPASTSSPAPAPTSTRSSSTRGSRAGFVTTILKSSRAISAAGRSASTASRTSTRSFSKGRAPGTTSSARSSRSTRSRAAARSPSRRSTTNSPASTSGTAASTTTRTQWGSARPAAATRGSSQAATGAWTSSIA